jgi:hypothetical protein
MKAAKLEGKTPMLIAIATGETKGPDGALDAFVVWIRGTKVIRNLS